MGFRIHKSIGYGIQDLQVDADGKPKDSRWNYEKWLQIEEEEPSTQDFLGAMKTQEVKDKIHDLYQWENGHNCSSIEIELLILGDLDKRCVLSHVIRDGEYAAHPEVLLFQPPNCRDWSRRDDIIDAMEEPIGGRVVPLQQGLYPYVGAMRRVRPPSPAVRAKMQAQPHIFQAYARAKDRDSDVGDIVFFNPGEYNQLVGRWDANIPPLIADPEVLKHFLKDWRQTVPFGVLALMVWLDCFPDLKHPDSMLNSLRPMLFSYWR